MPEATVTATNPTEAAPSTPTTEAAAATTLITSAVAAAETTTPATTTEVEPVATPTEPTEAKPAVVEGAPEKYEFKAPEGKAYDSNILTAFEASAREANLTQDAAQKLLDSLSPKIAERQTEQVKAINQEWLNASTSDKEFGGDALNENLGVAKKALDTFGSPELSKLLGSTGLGNHPEVIRAFYRIGKAISEDKFVTGAAPAGRSTTAAQVLYDKTA